MKKKANAAKVPGAGKKVGKVNNGGSINMRARVSIHLDRDENGKWRFSLSVGSAVGDVIRTVATKVDWRNPIHFPRGIVMFDNSKPLTDGEVETIRKAMPSVSRRVSKVAK